MEEEEVVVINKLHTILDILIIIWFVVMLIVGIFRIFRHNKNKESPFTTSPWDDDDFGDSDSGGDD